MINILVPFIVPIVISLILYISWKKKWIVIVGICIATILVSVFLYMYNSNEKNIVYEDFYLPMKNLLNDIRYEVEHFNLYRSGVGNKSVVLEKIFLLQKQVFLKEYVSDDSKDSLFIWNKFSDDIEVKLEKFRSYIYKIKPEEIDKIPIFVISNLKRPKMKKTQSTKNIDRSSL